MSANPSDNISKARWYASDQSNPYNRIIWISISSILLLALLDLAGWIFDIVILKSIMPQWIPMKIITAICFILAAFSLLIIRLNLPDRLRKVLLDISVFIISIASIGSIYIYFYLIITGHESQITRISFLNFVFGPEERMALLTSFNFLLIGLVIYLLRRNEKKTTGLAHVFIIPVSVVGYFAVASYILGVYSSTEFLNTPVALITGIAFVGICVTVLLMYPKTWLTKVFTSNEIGSIIAKRLLPGLLIIPLIIGWFRIKGEANDLFSSEEGVVLVAITYAFCFFLLVWFTTRAVNLIDLKRSAVEKALRESEDRFRTIAETLPVQISINRVSDSIILFANEAFEKAFGFSKGEITGRKTPDIFYDNEERLKLSSAIKTKGKLEGTEIKVRRKDGSPIWLLVSVIPITFGGEHAYLTASIDISDNKKARNQLLQLNRTLNANSKSSQAMMHAVDEIKFLEDVCKIIIEDCGHAMVWIGYAENDKRKSVKPVASYGFENGYIGQLNVAWDDSERGSGPTGTAIKTGKPYFCRNMHTDPSFKPWREAALKRGYASSLVLPLKSEGKTFGAISIYSKEPDPFSESEIGLLTNLANETAYGISYVRLLQSEKASARTLEESEKKFSTVFYSAPIAMSLVSIPDGKLYDVNQAWLDLVGIENKEEVVGKISLDMGLIPDKKTRENILAQFNQKGFAKNVEMEASTRTGEIHHLLVNVHKVQIGGKEYLLSTNEDITERKKMETALVESKEKLNLALDNGSIGVWEWDIASNVIEWDERMENIFGIEPGTFERSYDAFEKFLVDEDIAHVKAAINKALESDVPFETVYRIICGTGDIKYISAKALLNRNPDGSPRKMTGVCFDITEMKKGAEQVLFKLNEDLLRSNKELEQFAYVASHDLQEPLRMISSFTQLLSKRYKDKLDNDANEFIQFAVDGAFRMQNLINDLLQFSRIQTRGKSPGETDMNIVLGTTINNLSHKIQEKGAHITNDELPVICADSGQMVQLLQNLIGNSIKFCKTSPKIHISVKEEKDHFVFSVKDNGIGIEPQYFDKIFSIFQRLHHKEEYEGTGIGLAICRRIVERHSGKISVESKPGKGTTFRFSIRKNK